MTAITAGTAPRGIVGQAGRVVALDHGVVGRSRGAAGEGVGVTVVGGPACGYAAADVADGLCAGVGVVGVGVGGGDGFIRGWRGHGTCGWDGLAIHRLVADLGLGVGDGLGLDLVRDGLVLVLVLVLVLMMLVLHLVLLGNGLHRHRRTHAHVEGW